MRRRLTVIGGSALFAVILPAASFAVTFYPPGPPFRSCPDTLSIYSIQQTDTLLAPCNPAVADRVLGIRGVITGFDAKAAAYAFYIQNSQGGPRTGVDVFTGAANYNSAPFSLSIGDSVAVYGAIQEFPLAGGETEIEGPDGNTATNDIVVRLISHANPLPPFQILTTAQAAWRTATPSGPGEDWEGGLVRVRGPLVVRATVGTGISSGTFLCSITGVNDTICVDGTTLTTFTPPPVGTVIDSVQGIVNQRVLSGVNSYRIQIRDGNDLFVPGRANLTNAYPIEDHILRLAFDRDVDPATATTAANYTLTSGVGVLGAALEGGSGRFVRLTLTGSLPDGVIDSVHVVGVGSAICASCLIESPQTRGFVGGVLTVATVQTPDPALLPLFDDRSRFAGPGTTFGPVLSLRGTCTAVFGSLYYIQDEAGGARSGISVYGPITVLVPGRRYLISGQIQEFVRETELVNTAFIVDEGPGSIPTAVDVPIPVLRDTTQNLGSGTGEEYEGMLVRAVNARSERARGLGESFDVSGPPGAWSSIINVQNLFGALDAVDPPDSPAVSTITGVLHQTDVFVLAPRSGADIVADVTPPVAIIVSGPAQGSGTVGDSATFTWSGTDETPVALLVYATSLDGALFPPFSSLTSASLSGLSEGPHSFAVRARDLAGNESATVTRNWSAQVSPPAITFQSGPPSGSFVTTSVVSFSWGSTSTMSPSGSIRYQHRLDGGTFSILSADSVAMLTGLSEGSHTFEVQATDYVGLQSTASRTWIVDTSPPQLYFTGGPAEGSYVGADVTFTWSGDDGSGSGNLEFSYRLDGGEWSAWSPATTTPLTGLPEGGHAFELRGRDAAGNVSGISCSFDATSLVSWWPGDGTAADRFGSNEGTLVGEVGFVPGMKGSAFSIGGIGDHVQVPASPSLLPRTGSFTLEAWIRSDESRISGNLEGIAGWVDGQGTRSRFGLEMDPGGVVNFRVKGSHLTGGTGQVVVSDVFYPWDGVWHHVVGVRDMSASRLRLYLDGALAMESPLTNQSAGDIRDTLATSPFRIGAVSANSPPISYWGDIDEVMLFNRALSGAEIAAIYTAGGRDSCGGGAPRSFVVDITPPNTTILSGPAEGATITTSSPTFGFSGTDNLTPAPSLVFASELDGAGFGISTSSTSVSLSGLLDGLRTFRVRARDLAGNEDPTPAQRSFVVHAQAPTVTILTGPTNGSSTQLSTANFTWTLASLSPAANRAATTWAYKLDAANFTAESADTVVSLTGLSPGSHTLTIRATDDALLTGTAFRTWAVDTTPPVLSFVSGPANGAYVNTTPVSFAWTSTDAGGGVTYGYQLDGGGWSAYSAATSVDLSGLAQGSHLFELRAKDGAGNETALSCPFNATGLVSWWAGEGNANDKWGSNHGTLVGGTYGAGQVGQAFLLTSDYVTVPDQPSFNPGLGSFTIEAWVKTTSFATMAVIIKSESHGAIHPSGPAEIRLFSTNGNGLFQVRETGAGGVLGVITSGLANGAWHYVVGTRDMTAGTLNLYMDGTLRQSAALNSLSDGPLLDQDGEPDPLLIGAQPDGGGGVISLFTGSIDEAAYSSRALSATEIAAIYLAGGRGSCTSAAARAFTVDTDAPNTQIVTGPSPGSTVTTSSITLGLSGTDNLTPVEQLRYQHQVDGGGYSALSSSPAHVVNGLEEGPHTIDVRAVDLAGNVDGTPASRSINAHVEPPSKFVVFAPPAFTTQTSLTFGFSSFGNQPANTIEYATRLDSGAWSAWSHDTTASFLGVPEGQHHFWVRARDSYGLEDSTSQVFNVDLTAPNTSITGGPASNGWSNSPDVTFNFSGTDNLAGAILLTYAWSVDGGAYSGPSLATSAGLTGLAAGPHTFAVRALDPAGHTDASPASRTFIVDLVAPETQIALGPAEGSIVAAATASFSWDGTDDRTPAGQVRFSMRLDADAFGAPGAATSTALNSLPDGPHTFQAQAVDLADNVDATPATRGWIIDAQGPVVTFTAGPSAGQCIAFNSTTIDWTATDVVSPSPALRFAYSLDGAPASAYGAAQTASLTGLTEQLHTFTVYAKDERDHVTSQSLTFRVDLTAPLANAPVTKLIDNSTVRVSCTAQDAGGATAFHIQVATDPAFSNIVVDTNVGAAGQYDFAGTPGNSYFARAAATDCAGLAGSFGPVSNGTLVAFLADLVVTSVDVPPSITSGQVMQVTFTVENQSTGATNTPAWYDDLYLSPTPTFDGGTAVFLGRIQNLTFLAPTESYTSSANVTIPLGTAGTRYVLALADNNSAVPELNGGNNVASSPAIAVALGLHADLRVTQVVAPPTSFSGDAVAIQWTVQNPGTGRTNHDQWFDTVFFSDDSVFTFSLTGGNSIRALDTPVGKFLHTGALDPAETYVRSVTVNVPGGVSGKKYFWVATDMAVDFSGQTVSQTGSVFEHLSELNNFAASEAIDVTLTPPPDLHPTALTTPPAGSSGQAISLSWTVKNIGLNPTPNQYWTDRVYLSTDPVLNIPGDLELGNLSRGGAVAVDASYTLNGSFVLPNGISGLRYLFVYSDIHSQVGELLENNNFRQAAQPVNVILSDWANLQPVSGSVPDTGKAGQTIMVSWDVLNDGAAVLAGNWQDDLWLSPSPTWNPGSATRLAVVGVSRQVFPGATYSASATFTLPVAFAGTYYAYVNTDARGDIYEYTDEGDNLFEIGSLIVTAYPPVDLAVTSFTAPPSALSSGVLPLSWSVTNQGEAATVGPSWGHELWLSADNVLQVGQDILIGTPGHGGTLAPGASYSQGASPFLGNGFEGTYFAILRLDVNGFSGDGNPANNTVVSAAPIVISSVVPPNLALSPLTAPTTGVAGQPVKVRFNVSNTGAGVLQGTWFAACYFSQDAFLDGTDVALASKTGTSPLSSLASVADSFEVFAPSWASGGYHLIVKLDTRNEVWETTKGDNVMSSPILVSLPLPADLVITDVVVPAVASPGEPVTVSWTLRNVGANPAVGYLQNAVYTSVDESFVSEEDPLVGIEATTISLAPGAARRFTQALRLDRPIEVNSAGSVIGTLPPISPGNYFALVRANIRNNIRESNVTNNGASSAVTLEAQVASLTLGVPAVTNTLVNDARFYKVVVTAGQDLRFSVGTNAPDATNELYVAFGHVPSLDDFDRAGPPKFTATPVVLVPSTQAGTYYVMVVTRSLGTGFTSQDLAVLAEILPFSITSVAPSHGGGEGRVTSRLNGAQFRQTTVVRLEQVGVPVATGSISRYLNSTEIDIRWNLAAVPEGLYDVVAVNGPETAIAAAAFTVEPATPLAVTIESVHPDVMRRTAIGTFVFTFRNTSNQDVPALRARVFFPATSTMRDLRVSDGLLRRSDRAPALFTPVTGDYAIVHGAAGESLAVVDLVGADLRPGEERMVTLDLVGFATSPYSVRAVAEGMTAEQFIDRAVAEHEAVRRALLETPGSAPAGAVSLALGPEAFRDEGLAGLVAEGLITSQERDAYIGSAPSGVTPLATPPGGGGPPELLAELASEQCVVPNAVPECAPDVAPAGSALPACTVIFDAPLTTFAPVGGGVALPVLASTVQGFTTTLSANSKVVTPCDPNALTGPAGYNHWVSSADELSYRIDFENLSSLANAPAQVVKIKLPLDPDLDLGTFRLKNLGFGSRVISTGAGSSFSSEGFYPEVGNRVRITAGVNLVTHEAFWTFTTIDVNTGQPPLDPNVGFLPVNFFGEGTGFAEFLIKSKGTVASGTQIVGQASIQFDANSPVLTSTVSNFVDTQLPTSAVQSTIEVIDSTRVRVHWNATDDVNGVGLEGVALWMKRDSGPYQLYGSGLQGNLVEVPVVPGHYYFFYTIATDHTGNKEPINTTYDAAVAVGTPLTDTPRPGLPAHTVLFSNYPNPFQGSTTLRFDLATREEVTIEVFDVQGRLVSRPLDHKRHEPGHHTTRLERFPGGPGLYFYRFRAGAYLATRRMVVLR